MEGVVNRAFWDKRRVLVTGHTGFKGGWLCLALQAWGAHVRGFALDPDTDPNLFGVARVADGMHSTIGDIRDPDLIAGEMRDFEPEIVFHLAAQPLVRLSYAKPVETYMTNVMGTVHVLEAVRQSPKVRAVVAVTTDKCYENREWVWGYRESDPMGGHDPYSSSKGCAEIAIAAYRRSFFHASGDDRGVALASARAGNVIGGGDWSKDRLVPDVVAAFLAGQPVSIRSPLAVRPWQHVLEPVFGYLMLAERLHEHGQRYAEAWNFGPSDDDVRTVRDVVAMMATAWEGNASWEERPDPDAPHEAQVLKLDISKVRSLLGWAPRWSLSEAVSATIDWYRAAARGDNMREASQRQIEKYLSVRGDDKK